MDSRTPWLDESTLKVGQNTTGKRENAMLGFMRNMMPMHMPLAA